MKSAFITGITGQDGSYLTEFLLKKNYEVHGIIRPASVFTTERIIHIFNDKELAILATSSPILPAPIIPRVFPFNSIP